jgi:hypothetical protein
MTSTIPAVSDAPAEFRSGQRVRAWRYNAIGTVQRPMIQFGQAGVAVTFDSDPHSIQDVPPAELVPLVPTVTVCARCVWNDFGGTSLSHDFMVDR